MGSALTLAGAESPERGPDRIFSGMSESRLLHIVLCTETDKKCCMVRMTYVPVLFFC